jgi:CO dehydrogenase maturation factor
VKIAVSGKGGTGKTTVTALLAHRLAARGRKVLAVDADPDMNLSRALGFPLPDRAAPIVEMRDLVAERTGAGGAGLFRLNPRIDDLPERHCVEHAGIRLIVMGTVQSGGGGCVCPESAFLRALLSHLLLGPDEDVLVDMEAGLEHLGRGTASAVDCLLVVVDPDLRSLETLERIRHLAADLGLTRCRAVANKVASDAERTFLEARAPSDGFLAWLPFSPAAVAVSRGEGSLAEAEPSLWREIDSILEGMDP